MSEVMEEGASYPMGMDRRPALWWLLTSRRSQVIGRTGAVLETTQEDWSHAWTMVRYGTHYGRRITFAWWRLSQRKRACGCSQNWITRKFKRMDFYCPQHGMDRLFAEYGMDEEDS